MKQNDFEYTYLAPTESEREEIESIKKQYMPQSNEVSLYIKLKKLDAKVKNTPLIISLTLGVIGLLIFGLGLTCILEWQLVTLGIICGVIGVIVMAVAYPVYKKTFKSLKEQYGEQIVALSNQLLNNKE